MAKYHRTRKYTRYRRRSNWAANIQELSFSIPRVNQGANISTFVLAENPAQSNTTVSTVYTVKNFEITYTIETASTNGTITKNLEDFCIYIIYVPQGMTVGLDYNNQHPEYVMAMKFVGSPAQDGNQEYQPHRIFSRLARRLNTGDSIQLMIKFNNTYEGEIIGTELEIHGLNRWWTKTN